uniref:Uncharacterized protein n=1 Tax=Glossina austeni TaxID=7395 RepID=A0A1A9UD72_GLOAU
MLSNASRVSYTEAIKSTPNIAPVECNESATPSSYASFGASHNYAIDLSRRLQWNTDRTLLLYEQCPLLVHLLTLESRRLVLGTGFLVELSQGDILSPASDTFSFVAV